MSHLCDKSSLQPPREASLAALEPPAPALAGLGVDGLVPTLLARDGIRGLVCTEPPRSHTTEMGEVDMRRLGLD